MGGYFFFNPSEGKKRICFSETVNHVCTLLQERLSPSHHLDAVVSVWPKYCRPWSFLRYARRKASLLFVDCRLLLLLLLRLHLATTNPTKASSWWLLRRLPAF